MCLPGQYLQVCRQLRQRWSSAEVMDAVSSLGENLNSAAMHGDIVVLPLLAVWLQQLSSL